jgi:hypothetical protein
MQPCAILSYNHNDKGNETWQNLKPKEQNRPIIPRYMKKKFSRQSIGNSQKNCERVPSKGKAVKKAMI